MATEESNGAEFREKTGLKRKLTGPPRLLLGKSRSPGRDEKKSRKQRRQNNGDGDAPVDAVKDEQSSELHEKVTSECLETVLTTGPDGGTCMEVQDECLETNLEPKVNCRRKCKAAMTIRRIFSCGRRKKELGMKAMEDTGIQDERLLTHSGDCVRKEKKPVKKNKVRMWCIFKKRSSTGKQETEENKGRRGNEMFTDISAETSVDQQIPGAVEEQQKESSGIERDVTRMSEENFLESQEPQIRLTETICFNGAVNIDSVFVHENETYQHPIESHVPDLLDSEIPVSKAGLIEDHSKSEHTTMSTVNAVREDMLAEVPVFKCKPLITIEDVQFSDEENDELFTNMAPQYGMLSPLTSHNGPCCTTQTSDRRLTEILLAQTALSLVRAAIRGAVEQLSDELQSRQMEDLDHV